MTNPKLKYALLTLLMVVASILGNPVCAKTALVSELEGQGWLHLVPLVELLEDPQAQWSFTDVQAHSGWRDPAVRALNFGFSASAYWMRWTIVNNRTEPAELIVDLGNPREDFVTWHLWRHNGELETFATGDRFPYSQRPLTVARNFALPFILAPGESVQLYLYMDSYDGFFEPIPIKLYQRNYYLEELAEHSLVLTLYHGGLLSLLLYNILLYLATREKNFLLYVSYLFWFMMWNFTMNGYSFQYLWPNSPVLNNNFLTVCSAFGFALIGLFTIEYLQLKRFGPGWLVKLIHVLVALNFSVFLLSILDIYAISVAYGQLVGIAITLVVLGSGVMMLVKGQRQARFFMAAFTMLGVGVTAYILKSVTLLPSNLFTTWGLQFGSAFETLILALGLADSMNTLKQEKLEAERRAREAQQALNTGLEQQVAERTQELAEANDRLQRLAITDELTGAYNRRHFNTMCEALLSQQNRPDPVAFCMFDVDYFKRYNDHYGHSAGDNVLYAIAQSVQAVLKRSGDTLFRLGGEEFGVLFQAKSADAAYGLVEELQAAISELSIPHCKSTTGFVTASFGLTFWDEQPLPSSDRIYAVTDMSLYAAKEAGRNRIHFARDEELYSFLSQG